MNKPRIYLIILIISLIVLPLAGADSSYFNVQSISEHSRAQIDKLFTSDDQKTAVYFSGGTLEIRKDESFGLFFAIRNLNFDNPRSSFDYAVDVVSIDNCSGASNPIQIINNKKTGIIIQSSGTDYELVNLIPSASAPSGCLVRLNIAVTSNNGLYEQIPINIQITPAKTILDKLFDAISQYFFYALAVIFLISAIAIFILKMLKKGKISWVLIILLVIFAIFALVFGRLVNTMFCC